MDEKLFYASSSLFPENHIPSNELKKRLELASQLGKFLSSNKTKTQINLTIGIVNNCFASGIQKTNGYALLHTWSLRYYDWEEAQKLPSSHQSYISFQAINPAKKSSVNVGINLNFLDIKMDSRLVQTLPKFDCIIFSLPHNFRENNPQADLDEAQKLDKLKADLYRVKELLGENVVCVLLFWGEVYGTVNPLFTAAEINKYESIGFKVVYAMPDEHKGMEHHDAFLLLLLRQFVVINSTKKCTLS